MKKVVVIVDRGMTDKTPAIVYPHEVRLLRVIHGDQSVKVLDSKEALAEQRGLFEQLAISENYPVTPESEWDRCMTLYGMHPEVKTTVVQFAYGSNDDERWLAHFRDEKPLDELTLPELVRMAQSKGIKLKPKPAREEVLELLKEAA